MHFKLVSSISDIETIARGRGVRERNKLKKSFGGSLWRKMKGVATVELSDGTIRLAEIHWYEAHGIGRKVFKIKRYLDTEGC